LIVGIPGVVLAKTGQAMKRDSVIDDAVLAVVSVLKPPASKAPNAASSERRCIGNLLIDSGRGDAVSHSASMTLFVPPEAEST
jgi:hypothetical protein